MKVIVKNISFVFALLGMSLIATSNASAEENALDVVKNTSEEVIAKLKNESSAIEENSKRINELVDELIVPRFDFMKMSRWVLGKNWRNASKDQQTRFVNGFQGLLIRTYAKALTNSTDVKINYLPLRTSENDSKAIVKTEVDRNNGGPLIPIEYRLYKKNDAWLVYDVSIDHVSLISTYRGSINSDIKSKGLDAVITDLETRK